MINPSKNQRDWDRQLWYATFAYRCTPQESTGETPNMVMLGREVFLPIDLTVVQPSTENSSDVNTDFAKVL